jgi:hypothetical protein
MISLDYIDVTEIHENIEFKDDIVFLPNLVSAKLILCRTATTFVAPKLKYATLTLTSIVSLELLKFENGNINCIVAKKINLPNHKIGNILVPEVLEVNLPKHEHGVIDMYRIRSLQLPNKKTGSIYLLYDLDNKIVNTHPDYSGSIM